MSEMIRSLVFAVGCFLLICPALTGCAGSGTPLTGVTPPRPAMDSVSRLEGGRVGFVITENKPLDVEQRELFARGISALESGDYEAAVNRFKTITAAAPNQSSGYVNLAIAYIRSGRDDLAEKPLKKALELVAGHPLASHEYGLLLRRAGRFKQARAVYEDSIERFPEYYPLHKNLGVLCDIYLDDLKCAAREYELFLEAQPEDEEVRIWLAEVQGRLGR